MTILDYTALQQALESLDLGYWFQGIEPTLRRRLSPQGHGDFRRWQNSFHALPDISASTIRLDTDTVSVESDPPIDRRRSEELHAALQGLHPWRKGPFNLFGTFIDTEWRSDWKWQRLQDHISDLRNATVLDIGCGSGYHLWRMLGAGARLAIGVDPSILFTHQFAAVNRYVQSQKAFVLPLGIDDVAVDCQAFERVFSMGVLYHRQSPLQHLLALKGFLQPGGELVLETLVIDEADGDVLFPEDRYAQMRNVWFIPNCNMLTRWMTRCGFRDVRVVNVCTTSTDEQRSTEWMRFNSLKDFLDPKNPGLTVEGYPAPKRAIIIARSGE